MTIERRVLTRIQQLMNFKRIPEWTQGFIKSITPQTPTSTQPKEGDVLTVVLEGATFSPIVLVRLSLRSSALPHLTPVRRKTLLTLSSGAEAFGVSSSAITLSGSSLARLRRVERPLCMRRSSPGLWRS